MNGILNIARNDLLDPKNDISFCFYDPTNAVFCFREKEREK